MGLMSFKDSRPHLSDAIVAKNYLDEKELRSLGSLIFVLFCVSKKDRGWDNFVSEANTGKGLKVKRFMRGYVTYVLPVIILIVFAVGIYSVFN